MLAAAAALVFGASPAAAAPEPVEGAGSFNDAPVLAPGTYRDTIRNNEFVFYAVDLAEGERLRVRARLTSAPGQPPFLGAVALWFYSPWRVQDIFHNSFAVAAPVGSGGAVSRVRGKTPFVGRGAGSPDRARLYRDPGRYYFGFVNSVLRPKREHVLRFAVAVEGAPGSGVAIAPEPTPSIAGTPGVAGPQPSATPRQSRDDDVVPEPERDESGLVRLGLAGLLGGLAAGAGAGFLRRRP